MAQLGEQAQMELHDVTCCWLYLRKHMELHFPGELLTQHDQLFQQGCLAILLLLCVYAFLKLVGAKCIWPGMIGQMGLASNRGISGNDVIGRQMHLAFKTNHFSTLDLTSKSSRDF